MRKPKIVGLVGIDKGIRALKGIGENLNERVQDIAVAIVEHAAGPGNGDMSRALTLVQTINRFRTMNPAYLVGWFRYFGNANVNLRANDGAGKVSLISRDSKAYRGGFDVDGARANKWYDAFNADGTRSFWYQGPPPPAFEPATLGDIAEDMTRFLKREMDKVTGTKEVNGKVVPLVRLTEDDKKQLDHAFEVIRQLSFKLARHELIERKAQELAEVQEAPDVEIIVQPLERAVA